MRRAPTGTATFLMTDIEGSVRLWERDAAAMRQALKRHDAIIDEAISSHLGKRIKARGEGDSVFAVFERAIDAVNAGLEIQQTLCIESWPSDLDLRVRMSIHTGEAEVRQSDYYGPAVNRCARLRAIGHGGQILISESSRLLIADSLPNGSDLMDLGSHRLRDLMRPEHVFQLMHSGIKTQFPDLNSASVLPNNLPAMLSSFVGRKKEISEIESRLSKNRIVTLAGSGGCGKTRLAVQVAANLLDRFTDGVWLTELASLSDPALAPIAVAKSMRIDIPSSQDAVQAILNVCRDAEMLLVIDNCEHLITAVAEFADQLLRACPKCKILTTSREPLNIEGEARYRVPSMSFPPQTQSVELGRIMDFEAVELFLERALGVNQDFILSKYNVEAVAGICKRLDGIPLALELAASKLGTLSAEQIFDRLEDRFELLSGGKRTAMERHQTLRATIAWSFGLLDASERELAIMLSVFAGGWTLEATEFIFSERAIELDRPLISVLEDLVSKSIVTAEQAPSGNRRYRMLETIRQYCLEDDMRPTSQNDLEMFFDWFKTLASFADRSLRGSDSEKTVKELDEELDNLRLAINWGLNSERFSAVIEMTNGIRVYLLRRGLYSEGRSWYERALPQANVEDETRAIAANALAIFAWRQEDFETAQNRFEEALLLFERLVDRMGKARALSNLGLIQSSLQQFKSAKARFADAAENYEELGNEWELALALGNVGLAASDSSEFDEALSYLRRCEALQRKLDAKWQLGTTLCNIGFIGVQTGDLELGVKSLSEALMIASESGDPILADLALRRFAALALQFSQPTHAARAIGASDAARQESNIQLPISHAAYHEQMLDAVRDSLSDGPACRAIASGMAMGWVEGAKWAQRKTIGLSPGVTKKTLD